MRHVNVQVTECWGVINSSIIIQSLVLVELHLCICRGWLFSLFCKVYFNRTLLILSWLYSSVNLSAEFTCPWGFELSATCVTCCDNFRVNNKRDQADKATSCLALTDCLLMIFRRPRCLIYSKLASRRRRLAPPPWTLYHPLNANTILSIRWSLPPSSKSKIWRNSCNLFFLL